MQTLMTPESSTIRSINYDERSKELTVEFKAPEGKPWPKYRYDGVSKETWEKFITAQSKGKFLNESIKSRFQGVKL